MNELAYALGCENPVLGDLLNQYRNLHIVGLEAVANAMADSTAESLEALRFLSPHECMSGSPVQAHICL